MDLYYESLCPDSTRFISQQVPDMWAALRCLVRPGYIQLWVFLPAPNLEKPSAMKCPSTLFPTASPQPQRLRMVVKHFVTCLIDFKLQL